MDAFPAFIPLRGRRVILAGTGEGAEAKARLLEGSPAEVVRLTGPAAFDPASYAGAALAFVADEAEDFRQAAAAAARTAHVPLNVVDRPQDSDFYTPSVIDRGQVVVAIGTDGASPMLASMLRSDIEALAPEGLGRVAQLLRAHQSEVRAALPQPHQRRAFLRAALNGPAAAAALAGDMATAARLLLEALAAGPAFAGKVQLLSGEGPADGLTLRALRALASADLIVADPACDPQVLALARRDAERRRPADLTVDDLAGLAGTGLRIVRLLAGASARDLAAALTAAGAPVEVLPVAVDP